MSVNASVMQVFQQKNVPASIWVPIMMAESGGNANALNPNDAGAPSIGLFQLHVGGQANGWKQYAQNGQNIYQTLENPVTNAEIASGPIASAYQAGVNQGLSGNALLTYTSTHSGHPTNNGTITNEQSAIAGFASQGYGTNEIPIIHAGATVYPATSGGTTTNVTNAIITGASPAGSVSSTGGTYTGLAGAIESLYNFENPPAGSTFGGVLSLPVTPFHRALIVLLGIVLVIIGVAGLAFVTKKTVGVLPIPI